MLILHVDRGRIVPQADESTFRTWQLTLEGGKFCETPRREYLVGWLLAEKFRCLTIVAGRNDRQ